MLKLSSRNQTDEIEIITFRIFQTQMVSSHDYSPTHEFLLFDLEECIPHLWGSY